LEAVPIVEAVTTQNVAAVAIQPAPEASPLQEAAPEVLETADNVVMTNEVVNVEGGKKPSFDDDEEDAEDAPEKEEDEEDEDRKTFKPIYDNWQGADVLRDLFREERPKHKRSHHRSSRHHREEREDYD
jgi:hypothetical protein